MPLAYFLTFSTYGTRLHGHAEGSVDDEHNQFGSPYIDSDEKRQRREARAMKQPQYVLGEKQRRIVKEAILALASDRDWTLFAVHVRSTHVHVVVQTEERDPGRTLSDFKARASRELNRAGYEPRDRKRWSRHGSTIHLFLPEAVDAAIRYTLDEQGERMACYDARPAEERPDRGPEYRVRRSRMS